MKNYTVTLSEKDLQNAREFLQRVPLTGKEVPAFVSLSNALMSAKPSQPKTSPTEKQNEPTP